jgi:hypothetical protein
MAVTSEEWKTGKNGKMDLGVEWKKRRTFEAGRGQLLGSPEIEQQYVH